MRNLEISSKKLQVIQTAIQLFTTRGFHTVGVDLIAKQSQITKSTFYKYFGSKERLVEMCIAFQKSLLREKVLAIIYSSRYYASKDKLKEIIVLHTNLNSLYNLLLKAIFEIKLLHPQAYRMAVEYRRGLPHKFFAFFLRGKTREPQFDANMVVNLIDGLLLQVLGSNSLDERDVVLDCFLNSFARNFSPRLREA
ncbi:bacterial regulatory s, tetR family protein [Acinetobacter sp. 1130196]|uniref:TetR/AcrR family transcriptional regulator n=1 Tax=Acinetobacter sp. 1130196 TaxID=1310772 RepID=UPI000452C0D1|nr:TetR/AcrR family transcriptional regulator [Acinetobacter sp. 1130196]EXR16937.1 bacterial regulatory s, tetR family protein [Acinetobacter sp. 1130196]